MKLCYKVTVVLTADTPILLVTNVGHARCKRYEPSLHSLYIFVEKKKKKELNSVGLYT